MLRVLRRGRSTALHSHPLPLLQLSLLRSAGIYLHTNASLDNTGPGEVFHLVGNDMWRELLARFGVDEAAFPPKVLRPLWSLGVASLSQITLPRGDRSYVASNTVLTDALGALVPRSELNAARLSLNRLTLLLNGVSPKVAAAYTHVTPVQPDAAREIRPPLASRSHPAPPVPAPHAPLCPAPPPANLVPPVPSPHLVATTLTNLQAQGTWDAPPPLHGASCDLLLDRMTHFSTSPSDPDTDIEALGALVCHPTWVADPR